jgi:molybdopterin-guanine dinucleotide biosynthesis protein B
MIQTDKPILGFAAFSGTGKTTLLKQLLPILKTRGLRVGMIKHAHHRFEIDIPGKDSYELRKAGASQMLITSGHRWALMVDREVEEDPKLQEAIDQLNQSQLDLILVEGFKHESFPKIELHRPAVGKPLIYPGDPDIVAVATDGDLPGDIKLPVLDINDVQGIAEFVVSCLLTDRSA